MATFSGIRGFARRFIRDESATATVEFVILFPVVMWAVFSILESGWLLTQKAMLSRGLNMTIRELRLGIPTNPTIETVRARVCDNSTILKNCNSNLTVEIAELSDPISSAAATCVDKAAAVGIAPVVTFNPGSRVNPDVMVMRVCFVVDPLIPGSGLSAMLPKDPTGDYYQLVAYSAFVNEPI